jgi:hypothetical protein
MEPGRMWTDLVAARAVAQSESLYVRGRGVGGSSSAAVVDLDCRVIGYSVSAYVTRR